MAQYGDSIRRHESAESDISDASGIGIAFVLLASCLMFLVGSLHVVEGLAAVLDEEFYVVRPGYDLAIDVTTWGWLHMLGGCVTLVAGAFVLFGALWARIVGVLAALVSAVGSFYSMPYYPVWSILVLALDIGVIWALVAHGRAMDNRRVESRQGWG